MSSSNATKNALFVCSMNQWRSPTAEFVYRNDSRVHVRSAGTNKAAKRRVTPKDITWADLILVMEQKHKSRIRSEFPQATQFATIAVLDIPDNYQYQDPELIEILRSSIEPHL